MRQHEKEYTVEEVGRVAERLLREVGALEVAILKLSGRIEAFEGEATIPVPAYAVGGEAPSTMNGIGRLLKEASGHLDGCERHFQSLRAKIDQISNDAWSRDELKAWVKPPTQTR